LSDSRPHLCDRAHAWAALAPDGELSELERQLLNAHLARCAACGRFAAQVAAAVAELHAAALQPLPRPVPVPASRRPLRARVALVGAAGAVVVLALGIASPTPLTGGGRESLQLATAVDPAGSEAAEQQALRNLRREAIVAAVAARNHPTRGFGNQPAE
jgi:anti-sigma factor RsiW